MGRCEARLAVGRERGAELFGQVVDDAGIVAEGVDGEDLFWFAQAILLKLRVEARSL